MISYDKAELKKNKLAPLSWRQKLPNNNIMEVSLSNAPCDMMSTETSGESAQVAHSNFCC